MPRRRFVYPSLVASTSAAPFSLSEAQSRKESKHLARRKPWLFIQRSKGTFRSLESAERAPASKQRRKNSTLQLFSPLRTVELLDGILRVTRVVELDKSKPWGLARDPDVADATEAAELERFSVGKKGKHEEKRNRLAAAALTTMSKRIDHSSLSVLSLSLHLVVELALAGALGETAHVDAGHFSEAEDAKREQAKKGKHSRSQKRKKCFFAPDQLDYPSIFFTFSFFVLSLLLQSARCCSSFHKKNEAPARGRRRRI